MKDTVILDIETLGSVNNSVILSVGMVAVDSKVDYTFDELINRNDLKIVVQDPRTSPVGMGLLKWMSALIQIQSDHIKFLDFVWITKLS